MDKSGAKIVLVAFLSAVGIWAAVGVWQRHSIEKRVRTAESTVEDAMMLTPEDNFKIISATADREGTICLEYTSHDARRVDDIGYAIYERGETRVRYGMDADAWNDRCSAAGREDFTFSGR
jgi:hypothetical protein